MRYRHNITIDKSFSDKEWEMIETAFNRLIVNLPSCSKTAGANYKNEPIRLNDVLVGEISKGCRRISFNGKSHHNGSKFVQRSAHDFCLTQKLRDQDFNDSIDTEGYPYDLVVCAMLFFLKMEFPDNVFIHSDGSTGDWHHAVQWALMVLYHHQFCDFKITDEIAQLNWLEIDPSDSFERFEAVLIFDARTDLPAQQHSVFIKVYAINQWFY